MGNRGSGSGKAGGGRVLNLKQNEGENSKTVKEWLNKSDAVLWHRGSNTVDFFSHEGIVGTVKNVDNMNIRRLAKNL